MKLVKVLCIIALCSAFGTSILAQNMNEDFRKTPPAALAPVPFNIPKPFETKLSNGLKIVIFEDKRLPLVSFRLTFPTGNIYDPRENIGLSSAVSSLLTEGTKIVRASSSQMKENYLAPASAQVRRRTIPLLRGRHCRCTGRTS